MAMNPAADDIDLINLGFADDIRWIAKRPGYSKQLVYGLLHRNWIMRDALLLDEAPVTDQEELIVFLFGGGIDDKEIVGLDGTRDQALSGQDLFGALDGIAQPGGTLEIEMLSGLKHLTAQAVSKSSRSPPRKAQTSAIIF